MNRAFFLFSLLFVFRTHCAIYISSARSPTSGVILSVSGSGFTSVSSIELVSITGLSDDLNCTTTTIVSSAIINAVCFGIPPGVGAPHFTLVVLVNSTQFFSFPGVFDYSGLCLSRAHLFQKKTTKNSSATVSSTAPTINTISPTAIPTRGGTLSITGQNFGSQANDSTVVIGTGTGTTLTCTMPVPHTKLSCVVPPGTGQQLPTKITVGGQQFIFNLPALRYFSPNVTSADGNTDGTQVGIIGANFGFVPTDVTLKIAGVRCQVLSVFHETLNATCTEWRVPGSGNVGWLVEVTVATQPASALVFNFRGARLSALSPSQIPIAGAVIGIVGTNFGFAGTNCTARLDLVPCESCTTVNYTFATCQAAPAPHPGVQVRVHMLTGGQWASGFVTGTYMDFIYSRDEQSREPTTTAPNPYNVALPALSVGLAVIVDTVIAVALFTWLRGRKREQRRIEMASRLFPSGSNQPVEAGVVTFVADGAPTSVAALDHATASMALASTGGSEAPSVLLDSLGNIVYVHVIPELGMVATNAAGVPLVVTAAADGTAVVQRFEADGTEVYRALVSLGELSGSLGSAAPPTSQPMMSTGQQLMSTGQQLMSASKMPVPVTGAAMVPTSPPPPQPASVDKQESCANLRSQPDSAMSPLVASPTAVPETSPRMSQLRESETVTKEEPEVRPVEPKKEEDPKQGDGKV